MENEIQAYRRGFHPDLIDWVDLYKALIITKAECDLLEEFKYSDETGKRFLLEDSLTCKLCASAYFSILSEYMKIPSLGNALVALEELIEIYPPLALCLDSEAKSDQKTMYSLLLCLLHHESEAIKYLNGYIISKLIRKGKCPIQEDDLNYFLGWIKSEQRICSARHITMIMRILKTILHVDACRIAYYELEGVPDLILFLQEYDDFQILYDTIFCLWLMSFNKQLAGSMDKYDTIIILVRILDATVKVKVMRVILATFANLIKIPSRERSTKHCLTLLKNDVLKRLRMLELMGLRDEEMLSDMSYIKEAVLNATIALSTFEEFSYEVTSGNLRWGPVHTSPEFWKENAEKLNDNDYELLKLLLKWMDKSEDEEVIGVACFDTGQYLQYYPQGKEVIDMLGGKRTLLELLGSEFSTVQYEALHTLQKLLLNNWDNLGNLMGEQLKTPAHRMSS